MTTVQRKHLKTRSILPFNIYSKKQEQRAKIIANRVWGKLVRKYPNYQFNNLETLNLHGLDADFCIKYINRGYQKEGLPLLDPQKLQSYTSASGIKPDGGVFFVKASDGKFNHIIATFEVKHQGEYNGYTPISDNDWRKKKYRKKGSINLARSKRPPQAQGNAVERFAKNANAIKTLTSFYGYNPYIVFCEGFDFYLKEEFRIFKNQPYANKFKGHDSDILMRLIAGNDWKPLNKIYVDCLEHGEVKICPATIMARMQKWTVKESVNIILRVADKSLKHLRAIEEI